MSKEWLVAIVAVLVGFCVWRFAFVAIWFVVPLAVMLSIWKLYVRISRILLSEEQEVEVLFTLK